jgi:hypothetical protein
MLPLNIVMWYWGLDMAGWISRGCRSFLDADGCSSSLADHSQWALLAIALATLPACTTAVPLKGSTEFLPPSPVQVPLTVGVYHSSKLSTYKHSVQLTEQRFVFPLGEATVHLFKGLYPTLFAKSFALDTRLPLPANAPTVAAVIEPSIEMFNVEARPFVGGRSLCWAEIIYRFTVYSPRGPVLTSWRVRGIGERSGSELNGRLLSDAVELAMRDAAEKLQTSFFDVPEARRWTRKLPIEGVNAKATGQTTLNKQQTIWGSFPGVVSATAEVARDPQVPSVLSAKVQVKNEGGQRLFLRPFDSSLEKGAGGGIARVAPASALASSATPQLLRVPPLGYGPGFTFGGPPGFAVGNLISIFTNVAAMSSENRQLEEAFAKYRTETLRDTTLWQRDSVEFVVHFLNVPNSRMAKNLTVPVIDLDTATRYLIRLPVR